MKADYLQLRISEQDKEAIRKIAEERGMTMSELITFLIRREIDREQAK